MTPMNVGLKSVFSDDLMNVILAFNLDDIHPSLNAIHRNKSLAYRSKFGTSLLVKLVLEINIITTRCNCRRHIITKFNENAYFSKNINCVPLFRGIRVLIVLTEYGDFIFRQWMTHVTMLTQIRILIYKVSLTYPYRTFLFKKGYLS